MSESPFVDRLCLLEKFPGKGGWTFARIPEFPMSSSAPFGWRTVKGSIDGYPLKHYKLMPMGDGQLFLPVKAAIQKAIGKQAGDQVHVILMEDTAPLAVPEEIQSCFDYEAPEARATFQGFTDGERKAYLDWIYAAKTEETKARRIASMMERLLKGLRLSDQ